MEVMSLKGKAGCLVGRERQRQMRRRGCVLKVWSFVSLTPQGEGTTRARPVSRVWPAPVIAIHMPCNHLHQNPLLSHELNITWMLACDFWNEGTRESCRIFFVGNITHVTEVIAS